ncbi:hemagglutinin repeat-containing protein [Pelistega ratti]|nr:hemagglutinin repeat-containing protein [Pelistega ratti]
MKTIYFSLMLAWGAVVMTPVYADEMAILADKQAPGHQQATILQTANGLPQVNIQTPNAQGLSHNQYSQFDVAEKGAILNNARKAVQTQQAGWVQGNPNLASGEAKIILNEVNSNHPSQLKGYIEVAGKKAEVIIANPSGIHCDGCGMINASRGTFTTGKPQFNQGELQGFQVERGTLSVAKGGMDNSRVDYTDIIAEKVVIEGGIWGNDLKVTTGKNKVNRTHEKIVHIAPSQDKNQLDSTSNSPTYSVDVSQLGGMYAQRIQLIDNGDGLGVRNTGHIGASAGQVVIDSQGNITNKGIINAKNHIVLNAKKQIHHQGDVDSQQGNIHLQAKNITQQGRLITRQENIDIKANDTIEQQGITVAKGHIHYQAPFIQATKESAIAAGVSLQEEDGQTHLTFDPSSQPRNILLEAKQDLRANGKNIATGQLKASANKVDLAESQTRAKAITLDAHQSIITLDKATVVASDTLQLNTPQLLSTQQAKLKAESIKANAKQVDNQQGQWVSKGSHPLTLSLAKGLNNQQGLIFTGGNFTLSQQAEHLNNQGGSLLAGESLTLKAKSLDNQEGWIVSDKNMQFSIVQHINNQKGNVASAKHLDIEAIRLDNKEGFIIADENARLAVIQQIDNQKVTEKGSFIQAQQQLSMTTQHLNNQDTKTQQTVLKQGVSGDHIQINTATLDNKGGGIYALSDMVLTLADTLQNNQGELLATQNLTLTAPNVSIINTEGIIQGVDSLKINAKSLTGDGDIGSERTHILLKENMEVHKDIIGRALLSIHTLGQFINRAGLLSDGKVEMTAQAINNTPTGKIQGKSTTLVTQHDIVNRGLILGTEETILKTGNNLSNIGKGRIYGGKVALQAGHKIINTDELQADGVIKSAVIAAKNRLDIASAEIENSKTVFTQDYTFNGVGGTITSQGQLVFGRTLDTQHQAQGQSDRLTNLGGLIEGRGVILNSKKVENQNARLRTALEEVDNQEVDEHYLVSDRDPQSKERISFEQLRWAPYSRAGKVVYKNVKPKKRPADGSIDGVMLPMPNEEVCVDEATRSGCAPSPEAIYKSNDPVWAAFNITPPKTDMPNLPSLSQELRELEEPDEPKKPRGQGRRESNESYQKRLKAYENAVEQYKKAMADYTAKLIAYSEEMKPYMDWMEENGEVFEQLNNAIDQHNRKLAGREFYDFWDIYITQRIKRQTQVKETHPGKIVSEGDLAFSGDIENNRSQIVASGRIYNPDNLTATVHNEEEWGITQVDDIGNQEWTRTKWRGGLKRYHQRKWDGRHSHLKRTETPLSLNQASTQAYTVITPITEKADLQKENISIISPQQVMGEKDTAYTDRQKQEIRYIRADTHLPTSSLYRLNPAVNSHVLIETDPYFTNRQKWLSSDYMFKALRVDPTNVLKRLGDGYYEQRLVRDQVHQLTGRMFLGNYRDLEKQYKALMDNGISFAQRFNLTPGIALSAAHVAQLTSDIVWFEDQAVSLPTGEKIRVIVPRVYAVVQKGDLNGQGSLLSGDVIDLSVHALANRGTIAAKKLTHLTAKTLLNEGHIQGDTVGIKTVEHMVNKGGVIEGTDAVLMQVGGDFTHESTSITNHINLSHFTRSSTHLARQALVYTKGENGTLQIQAENIYTKGADIINAGKGLTYLGVNQTLEQDTLSVGFDEKMGKGNHYRHEKEQKAIISHIKGGGSVVLKAKDIQTEGASWEGARLIAHAENDMVLKGATTHQEVETYHHFSSGNIASKRSETVFNQHQAITQMGTAISGKEVLLSAGHDIQATGLQAIADNDLLIQAGNNMDITADTNYQKAIHYTQKTRSGLLSGGGLNITIGKQSQSHRTEQEGWTQSDARSVVGSIGGNVTVQAGNHVNVTGTDMITTPDKHLSLSAEAIRIEAGKDIIRTKEAHEYKQSGVSISLSSAVTDAAQSVMQSVKRKKEVKSQKLKDLYTVKATYEALNLPLATLQTVDTLSKLSEAGLDKDNVADVTSPTLKLGVSIGASRSRQESTTREETHQASELSGGVVNLTAEKKDIDIIGSAIKANALNLTAANQVNIESAQNTYQNRSSNSSSGWSMGAFATLSGDKIGVGVEASAQKGKGRENTDTLQQSNSYLQANTAHITTGQDLNLKGAVAQFNQIEADIGGNLNIISRQDSNQYNSKQSQAGINGTYAVYGKGTQAGANYSKSKAKVNYQQVEEQTGLYVGQGGMAMTVSGHTHLQGAIIDSQAPADKNRLSTNTFSHQAIQNISEVDVKSVSGGVSTNAWANAPLMLGTVAGMLGNQQKKEESTTQSAVGNTIAIHTLDPNSQENLGTLLRDTTIANQKVKAFDIQAIREQQEAGKVAGELASRIVGDIAQQFNWAEGSTEKILLHAIAGGLAAKMADGNVAVGAGSAALSEWVNTEVAEYLSTHAPQLNPEARKALQQATAMGIGVLAGATIGGNKAAIQQGALASFNVEKYNRQLHPDEVKWIKENAKHFAKEESERLGYLVTEKEAMQRLFVQAAQEVDFAWSKKIGSTDYRAQSFLRSATAYSEIPTLYSDNRGTFINADGKRQVMFTADKNEYVSTGKYARELAKFDKANNNIITKTLQPEVKNNLYVKSLQDGANTVINTANYMGNHPDKVAKSIVFNTMNCLTEDMCISAVGNTFKESAESVWQSGKDIGGIHYNLNDVNYLYGKDMRAEIDTIAAVRGGTALLELIGVGKTVGTGAKVVGKSAAEAATKTIADLPNLQVGHVVKPKVALEVLNKPLPKGYQYTSLSEITGPKGGVYHYIGDDEKGTPIFFSNNQYISFENGAKQVLSTTPEKLVFNGERLHPNLPKPVAGYEYKPSTLSNDRTDVSKANQYSHINGYIHEIKLANAVAERPDTQVIKWGDSVGKHGSDIISVNTKTGEVELWDSKYRSHPTVGEISPTFDIDAKKVDGEVSNAFNNAIEEARREIQQSTLLSTEIRNKALNNLESKTFNTYTVGSGKVKNSVIQKYCSGEKC